jgi:hypothetical protein
MVSNTYRKHNPTSAIQMSAFFKAIFNGYGPIGGHFGSLPK